MYIIKYLSYFVYVFSVRSVDTQVLLRTAYLTWPHIPRHEPVPQRRLIEAKRIRRSFYFRTIKHKRTEGVVVTMMISEIEMTPIYSGCTDTKHRINHHESIVRIYTIYAYSIIMIFACQAQGHSFINIYAVHIWTGARCGVAVNLLADWRLSVRDQLVRGKGEKKEIQGTLTYVLQGRQ